MAHERSNIRVPPSETVASQGGDVAVRPFGFDVVTLDAGRETERRRRHAQHFTEDLGNGVTLEMAQIPAGTFTMGAPASETGSSDAERPQHPVTLRGFYLGKHAVTIEQWAAVMGALPDRMKTLDASFTASARQPVVRVSFDDAEAFCTQLSRTAGRDYRLPTEAEWEYGCRAGTTAPYWFGETIRPELVNYAGEPGCAAAPDGKRCTMPVGGLGVANGFGLFDMHGNVWEWCQDMWHSGYDGAPVDGGAWTSGADARTRVLRGGGWRSPAKQCRAASRSFAGQPTARSRQIGFRVAMTAGIA
jgi:formylglycine-generating enzyme required for sulfatase activity